MTTRTRLMRPMENKPLLDRIFYSTAGRIFTAATQTFLISTALLLLFSARLYVEVQLLKYTVVLCVGLAAGFSARRFLTGRTRVLQALTAILSAALSLAVQYTLSQGFIGAHPFPAASQGPDWGSLVQLGTAWLGALLVVFAFRKPRLSPPQHAGDAPAQEEPLRSHGSRPNWSRNLRLPFKPKASPLQLQAPSQSRVATQRKDSSQSRVSLDAPPASKKKETALKRKARTSTEIHFIGEEEHTCPYCLDRVEKDDPRGVKVCPICKTWHHADCWGITGACQIPHAHQK